MMGSRDSELAVVVEDSSEFDVDWSIGVNKKGKSNDGGETKEKFTVRWFAQDMRKRVFKSIFGFTEDAEVEDPLSPAMWEEIERRKSTNTEIYREIFGCYPDSTVPNTSDLEMKRKERTDKPDHVRDAEMVRLYDQKAHMIKGFCVEFPLAFLSDENLRKMQHFEFGLYMLPCHIFT